MNNTAIKKLSPALFGFALFCFLLPFVTMACPAGSATLTGIQLATGTEIQGQEVGSEPLAALAFVVAAIALGVSFVKTRQGSFAAGLMGTMAFVFLLLLQLKLRNDVIQQGNNLAALQFNAGYWLSLLGVAAGAAARFFVLSRAEEPAAGQSAPAPADPGPPPVEGVSG